MRSLIRRYKKALARRRAVRGVTGPGWYTVAFDWSVERGELPPQSRSAWGKTPLDAVDAAYLEAARDFADSVPEFAKVIDDESRLLETAYEEFFRTALYPGAHEPIDPA
ncbi:hypothetical protein [Streptomyces nanshensis]|uniref:Uncharacterized protein n=1 Tax=Streptomyces nanshensis TaxID=518642 RepID=A0A1E7LAQ8_9ACTN|nr:hypothetical protein [Streptomyces nanshensis]OEV13244.1 hypothetical protein AN218_04505 [Streptomyces nanshensis]